MFLLSYNIRWLNPFRIATIVSLLLFAGTVARSQNRQFTQEQAVKAAEQFIAQNGYTDISPDKSKLSYETIEWESDVDRMLKVRHNTLERKAFGVVTSRKGGTAGWTVVFRYKQRVVRPTQTNGRAVTMNLDGSNMRVEHVDFILKYAKKL